MSSWNAYIALLGLMRSYQRIRRRIFRPIPPFLSREAAELFGWIDVTKMLLTVVAIASCPDHFFRRFPRLLNGSSPFFLTPLQLMAQTTGILFVLAGVLSLSIGKGYLSLLLGATALAMPLIAVPLSVIAAFLEAQVTVRSRSTAFGNGKTELRRRYGQIFSLTTYCALNYRVALWEYLYFTVYQIPVVALLSVFFLLIVVIVLLVAETGILLLVWIMALLLPVFAIGALGLLASRLFTEPYLQLLKYALPDFGDGEIQALFYGLRFSIMDAPQIEAHGIPDRWNPAFRESRLKSLSDAWDKCRAAFLDQQRNAKRQGIKQFSRFLLTREKHACEFTEWVEGMIPGRHTSDLFVDAPQASEDLEKILERREIPERGLSAAYRKDLAQIRSKLSRRRPSEDIESSTEPARIKRTL